VAGLGGEVVRRAQDRVVLVEVAEDLAPLVGVVAERDDVHAGGEQLVGDLRGDPQAARGVLAVDHDEGRVVLGTQARQQGQQRPPPEPPDDVADEQDGGRRGATATRAGG
jgi:hypothetical protein